MPGETENTAAYIAAEIVKQAIGHAGDAIPDRAAENHAIRSRGRLEIPQTWEWDLDDGVVGHIGQPDAASLDLWYEAVNADLRYIVPTNHALLSVVGQESAGYAGCASARLPSTRIALNKFKKSTFVCVRTGEDRYSEFSIEDLFAPNAEKPNVLTLVIEYKTWER